MKSWDEIEKPKLSLESVLFTMGSCFAKNLRERLRKAGLTVFPHEVATKYNKYPVSDLVWYTPTSIMQEIELAFGEIERIPGDFWQYGGKGVGSVGGRVQDYYRRLCVSRKQEWLEGLIEKVDANVREGAMTADAFIFTLGHIEPWRSKTSGRWACIPPIRDRGRWAQHVVLTEKQVKQTLRRIVSVIRKHRGPEIPIIFTVSPVRMVKTFRQGIPTWQANKQSKNRLRIAAKAICQETGALYYPSYEMVTSAPDPYFADKIHVRQDLVQEVVDKFLRDTGIVEESE